MSQELVEIKDLNNDEIMEMIGQTDGSQFNNQFAFLGINKEDEDDNGNPIPKGSYVVYSKEHKANVYAKSVKFRPFIQTYQYRVWDEGKRAFANRSIFFKNWEDEKFDEKGGLACGKVARKKWDQLTDGEKEIQKKVRCSRVLWGVVSLEGIIPALGERKEEAVTLTNYPCVWRTAGNNFIPVGDVIEKITRAQKLMFNHNLLLSLKKEKTGSNTYYLAVVDVDLGEKVPLTQEEFAVMREFNSTIVNENNTIIEKWRKARDKKPNESDNEVIDVVAELAAPEELNDPIDDLKA